jgi:hypothetical protein
VTQVKSFLGAVNFNRKLIADAARLMAPPVKLCRDIVNFKWTERREKDFQGLKNALCTSPVMTFPDLSKTAIYSLVTDASAISLAGALFVRKRKRDYVVAYTRSYRKLIAKSIPIFWT